MGGSLEVAAPPPDRAGVLVIALGGIPRQPLRAEDLLEQVWDEHADPFTNTVFVTISRLRRKLGDPPVIENVPNVGYRIMHFSG
jgi:DNA-binding response OmpR family regulator